MPITDETKKEVQTYLAKGEKIAAAEFLVSRNGVTHLEAAKILEQVARDGSVRAQLQHRDPAPGTDKELRRELKSALAVLVGCIFLAAAILTILKQQEIVGHNMRNTGIVTGFTRGDEGGLAPVVSYEFNGYRHQHKSNFFTSSGRFKHGDRVPIFVNPANPTEIVIDTFDGRWLELITSITCGLGSLGLALYFRISDRTVKKIPNK